MTAICTRSPTASRRRPTEILGFYRNYHSLRFVGHTLVIRLQARPAVTEMAALSEEFADITGGRPIEALDGPLPPEARTDDHADLPRIALRFDRMSYARLRLLIDAVNDLPSAPPRTAIAGLGTTDLTGPSSQREGDAPRFE